MISKKKSIALVSNNCWTKYRFRKGLIKILLKSGYKVYVIAGKDKYHEKIEEIGAIYIEAPFNSSPLNLISSMRYFIAILKIYRRYKFNLIIHYTIVPNIFGSVAAKLSQLNSISVITGLGHAFLSSRLLSYISSKLYLFALNKSKKVLFVNHDDRNYFVNNSIVSMDKTEIINVDVDVNYYVNYKSDTSKKIKDSFIFLMVSRIIAEKGIYEFIDAANSLHSKYPNFKFHLLGGFYEENPSSIDKKIIDDAVSTGAIKYLGEHDDVRPFIAQSDCVVLPSYREAKGLALVEAGLMGKPLIATNVPGCRDIVTHGYNGFLCESKNAFDLSQKMLSMGQLPPENLKKMSQNSSIKMFKDFNQNMTNSTYITLVQQIVD